MVLRYVRASHAKITRAFRASPRLWLFLACAALGLAVFLEVAEDVFLDPVQEGDREAELFDEAVARFIVRFRSPLLTQAMTDLTALGSVSVFVVLSAVGLTFLGFRRDRLGLGYLLTLTLGTGALNYVLKELFGRERPDAAGHLVAVSNSSFPSGHSFSAAAIYSGLVFLVSRHTESWRLEVFLYFLAALLIVCVGLSRIYLGVHYTTDVMAGIGVGLAWSFLLSAGATWWVAKNSKNRSRRNPG